MEPSRRWEWGFGVVLVGLVALAAPILAAEQVLFGPATYTRTSGPPNQFLERIPLPPTLTAPFRLHVQNGNPNGTNRVSSATITLNGTQVAGPADFSQQVAAFDRTVTLQTSNTLQVRLTSTPGSFLVLTLYGTIPPPTVTRLEPPSLPITQGGTGSLTATISAAQPEATTITLESSNTAVATVPPMITVPAGSVAVPVPVVGLSLGTATITATLNASSLQSTVTVAPAGPTLTSLLPATLQVTQGAAGLLTVMISAAQAANTIVPLTSSNGSLVSLPPSGSVTVPAGQTAQAFAVFGVGKGTATITATLNGTTAESQVTVVIPLPTVVSLLPPILPLTEGSAGSLTVTLNASQPTDTEVVLTTSDATVVGLPGDRVTVPANSLSVSFPVTGLTRGTATVTTSLNGTSAMAAITVAPPPPTLTALTCPGSLTTGATGLCTVTLNATQLTETVIPLSASPSAVLGLPTAVTVPANTLTAAFAVTGLAVGTATITAGPLNNTTQSAALQVLPPPPTLVSLLPSSATLFVGATASLTLTLNAAQLADTVIPLSSSPPGVLSAPATVTVPAGAVAVAVPVQGVSPGTATLTAGPLNGTQAESTVTVNQLPPTISALAPGSLSLAKGRVGTLTVTIAPTQAEPTVVPLSSSAPSAEVPGSVTVPAGASTAEFPVVARSEGTATITAGPLNGSSQTVTVTVTPAELVTLAITPPAPTIAKGQTQQFTATGTYTDGAIQDLTGSATWTSSDPAVATITSPGGLATGHAPGVTTITATVTSTTTVTASASLTVTPPILARLAITPETPTKTVGRTLQFQATGTLTDGTTQDLTSIVAWTSSDATVATISATGLATALAPGQTTITATHPEGFTASTILTATILPPNPITVAPPLNRTAATPLATATAFLYTGPDPVQTGVTPGAIEARRAAVLRGRVLTREGSPLSGVTISILNHPEYGTTLSRTDGMFDLSVNGGSQLTVQYQKAGFLPAQRPVTPAWQDYAWLPEVALIPYDARVTTIDLTAPAPIQVARGSQVTDSDGTRQATLFLAQGTTATMQLPDGTTQPLTTLSVRATEYTVGPNGPQAMPAPLPPNTGYTYAVELSVDEAVTQGAKHVSFDRAVYVYVENFLNFPVGGIVPVGYYDPAKAAWLPSDNGKIVRLLGVTGGLADLDTDGTGVPATPAALTALGITDAERQSLATLYAPGLSLWRFPVRHFSSWDANWGLGVAGGRFPNQPKPRPQNPEPCPTGECGSILETQNQTLGEALAVTGTPFRLHYQSDRVPGRTTANRLSIPASDGSVPSTLKRIELEVQVAGRRHTATLPAAPNQTYTFTWDGQDGYGRALQGAQSVITRVGYTYDAVYEQPAVLYRSFGYNGLGLISGSRSRMEMTLWQEDRTLVGAGWDARGHGLGGWSLNVHHAYDFSGRTLYLGDGRRREPTEVRGVISTVAGGGSLGQGYREGVQATRAALYAPTGLAVDGRGTLYVAENGGGVLKVSPTGILTTVVPSGQGFSGDGGPALNAKLYFPMGLAVDAQGNLFIADEGNRRIRKVDAAGIITTVAGGGGTTVCAGQQVPATSASVIGPTGVAVDGQGNLLLTDVYGVLRLGPDGILTRVAGLCSYFGFADDGGAATAAKFDHLAGVAVDAQGTLYIADQRNQRIRKVGPDGIITTVAGSGPVGLGYGGYAGDGGPATSALLNEPSGVAVDAQGNLYIYDQNNSRIRKVGPDGIITTVAGTGTRGYSGDGGPAIRAQLDLLWSTMLGMGVAVDRQGAVVVADLHNQRVRRIDLPYPGFSGQEFVLPSEDGAELYVFSPEGRHLRTQHALTGAIRSQFGYDAQGRLVTITDGDNNVTHVERDGAGAPTALVAPDGQRTTLTLDGNAYLATLTNPAGETHRFTYSPDGLMQTYTTPRNHAYRFTYDPQGRLTRDEDPATGFKAFARTESGTSYTVTMTTAENRASTYLVDHLADGSTHRMDTAPDGTATTLQINTNATRTTTSPGGTVTTLSETPDPRFAMLAPLPGSLTVRLPSGLTSSLSTSRTVTLSDPNNLLSLTSQTDTITLNGRTATSTYSAATKTFTDRSPANRQVTRTIDAQGRVIREQVDALEPVAFSYDTRGRLSTVTQGTGTSARLSTFTYNPEGFLETITDPLTRTSRFTYDAAGRVTVQTLPDLREIRTTYDANGNVASITPPSRPAHAFGYTPIDLEESYTPPDLGIGPVATAYTYNADRQLTLITRPDGQSVSLGYDTGGRLNTLTEPRGQTSFTYHPTSGQVASIASPGGVSLGYTYDGSLLTATTWSGPVSGSVARTYDTDFRVASESVNGGNSITFQYDPDSLLTQAGNLTITRSPQHGLLTGTTLGSVADSYGHSTFGELSSYQATSSGSPLLGVQYTRDALGRITQKVETISGVTTTTVYGYDTAGRLTDVTQDGTLIAHYEYDGNGNRLSVTRPGVGTVSGTYDAQDRLTTYGAVSYTYNANGDLLTSTSGSETTTYSYDVFGNLTNVTLPNARQIEYVIDGQNRRIGKKVNGVLTRAFLYNSQLRPVAELDGAGNVVSRFVYGTKANVPDYMTRGGTTYRLLTDRLGSVRLVLDTATGTIAQRLDYDEFGQITQDTAPGFQPFGFAGGLYDPDTNLTRFGFRDYDPFTGRWTTKDPIRFSSYDSNLHGYADSVGKPLETNLYSYAGNSPVNSTDPLGLFEYKKGSGGPLDRRTEGALRCLESCLGREVVITGAREPSPPHQPGSAHNTGQACDLGNASNPGLQGRDVERCFQDCVGPEGFEYGQQESSHYHLQTRPGLGGARGFAPGIR